MWHENILGTIGNTPLVKMSRVIPQTACTVLAKVEFFSPGSSVKDRIGAAMIDAAEADGSLAPGGTIIEGTSGNTGAGVALAAIARGYHCIFTTTDKQSQEKVDVLRALGAEVLVCPTAVEPDDPRSYYSVARRLASEIPNSVYLNQYDNPSNTEAHYRTTGPELWEQTDGKITHLVAGAGTGGTISGAARYLKEQNPEVQIIAVDPFGSVYFKYFHTGEFDKNEIYPYFTEGAGEDILAENMDFDMLDDYVRIDDKHTMQMTRRLAAEEGLFCGQSSGMAVAGAAQWLRAHSGEMKDDDVMVVLLPDSGFRYLSKTYNDTWMHNHGFLEKETDLTVEDVLAVQSRKARVVAIASSETLDAAIDCMTEGGISQIPVIDDGKVVGSLTENGILNRLIEEPAAREKAVSEVMGRPFAVVPASLHLEHLSSYLEQGAVLVQMEDENGYNIITKSDLINALSKAGRNGSRRRGR